MKLLGIDYGTRKIGLALADTAAKVAVPFGILKNSGEPVQDIIALAKKEHIEAFVVGIAIPESPEQSQKQSERTKRFASALAQLSGLPVHTVAEGYTSRMAQLLQEQGADSSEDALAAMLILEEFLASAQGKIKASS